jgi:predicted kinase
MISLVQLLLEVLSKPKAIFLAGPAGSGKSYISKQLIPTDLEVINVDDSYEELLKSSGLGTNQKNFTPDQLSQSAKLMGQARKITTDKYNDSVKSLNNIVIDGTGGASNPLLKKKQELEALGYDTLMLMIYVSPLTSLQRNKDRERSLLPGIILRTWRDVNKNIELYKKEFGNNFILINNDPKDAIPTFDQKSLQPFIDDQKATGKPKTPEEQLKSDNEKKELNADIEQMVKILPEFDDLNSSKLKISTFLK